MNLPSEPNTIWRDRNGYPWFVTDMGNLVCHQQQLHGPAELAAPFTRLYTSDELTRGDWMQTYMGHKFFPMSPRAEEVDPFDIAHGLSMVCRYGGHVDRFYSVAEHCILMSEWAEDKGLPEFSLMLLLHDASEAYVGDMVRPLKHSGYMDAYKKAEDKVTEAIHERFKLFVSDLDHAAIKEIDTRILLDERTALMRNYTPSQRWTHVDGLEELGVAVQAWAPIEAEARYLDRLSALGAM